MKSEFFWQNESKVKLSGGMISIWANDRTDFFCNLDGRIVTDAAMYFQELQGNCVIRAKVSMEPPLGSYDGAGLIIYSDDRHWIKGCLEVTDFGTIAAISVVTNGVSDDANGPDVNVNSIWLQITRKNDDFAVHYSLDGQNFNLQRICQLVMPAKVRVGLIAQAPLGQGGYRTFENVFVEEMTVADIRKVKL